MRSTCIWLGALLALGLLNWAVWQKESALATGEPVYLKLAPVDPRSLMQGDYMVLNYAIARELPREALDSIGGKLIVRIDEKSIGHFARMDDGSALKADERYLAYKNRRGAKFGIESFFFQEGRAEEYASADYAAIRLSKNGSAILVDLIQAP